MTAVYSQDNTSLEVVEIRCGKVQRCLGNVERGAKSIQRDVSRKACSALLIWRLANEVTHQWRLADGRRYAIDSDTFR